MTVIRFGALQFLIAVLSIVICGGVLEAFFYLREETRSKVDEAAVLPVFAGVYPSTPKDILGLKRNFKQDWFTSEFSVVVETNSAGLQSAEPGRYE